MNCLIQYPIRQPNRICDCKHGLGRTRVKPNMLALALIATPVSAQTGAAPAATVAPSNAQPESSNPPSAVPASNDENAMVLAHEWTVLEVSPPPIRNRVIVNAPPERAWAAWTQSSRMLDFMGFAADIEPRPGGRFHITFNTSAKSQIERGNDGQIIAMEPGRMLSFTWMTPMHMAALTGNSTLVTLYFTPLDEGRRTEVELINTGYGTGKDWRAAHLYNVRGWDRVLSHFQYAMNIGPIDWVKRAADLKRDGTLQMWREQRRRQAEGDPPKPH
jgi:uncharacterized protein YndB with AHSA1/START domain